MDDASVLNLVITVDDLVHEGDGLGLGERAAAADHFSKVASFAEFCDDVGIVAGIVDVKDFYNVVTIFEAFENLNF